MSNADDLCKRLRALPVAVVSDVLAAAGLGNRVLAASIRSIGAATAIAGPAFCLGGYAATRATPAGAIADAVYMMDRRLPAGSIAVIATSGECAGAVVGGNVALSWKHRGCAGVVTDGAIRDAEEFRQIELPVYCSFVTPISNKGLWSFATLDEPVRLPAQVGEAIQVFPGDLVHADGDGVVIVPARHAERIVADAEIYEAAEGRIRDDVARGEDREVVYKRHDRAGHIKPVEID